MTKRDYTPSDPSLAGIYDSYFLYDNQDRVICETTTLQSTCPTTGGANALKNNHSLSPPFTAMGDWKRVLRQIPGSSGLTNDFNPSGYGTAHQVYDVNQSDGTPVFGHTSFAYDVRGNRTFDDNTTTMTNDRRDYTYDARSNLINVRGQYYIGGVWHYYDVASAFDAKNRRVYKSFYDETTLKTAQWFFYYDPYDRLTEVRYTPDISAVSTYSTFQLFWLEDRLTAYWQTDYPSVTTSKRYVGTDETGRPVDMWNWPATGDATRVWAVNPTAWGFDTTVVGSSVFQPVLFGGQYNDSETAALQNNGTTVHRPGVVLNGFRTYDSFTGGYLQVDPMADRTRSAYGYADSNPVGREDPLGLNTWTEEGELGTYICNDYTNEYGGHCELLGGKQGIESGGGNPTTPTCYPYPDCLYMPPPGPGGGGGGSGSGDTKPNDFIQALLDAAKNATANATPTPKPGYYPQDFPGGIEVPELTCMQKFQRDKKRCVAELKLNQKLGPGANAIYELCMEVAKANMVLCLGDGFN